jgi:hypothetical protein
MPRPAKTKRLVFVSHSSRDTWVAKQIAREILNCGATPFLDNEIEKYLAQLKKRVQR